MHAMDPFRRDSSRGRALRAPGSSVAGSAAAAAYASSYDHVARSPRASAAATRARVAGSESALAMRTAVAPQARAAAFTAAVA